MNCMRVSVQKGAGNLKTTGYADVVIIVLLLLIIVGLLVNRRAYVVKSMEAVLKTERYHQLSKLSREYYYEYDIVKDILLLPADTDNLFNCGAIAGQLSNSRMIQTAGVDEKNSLLYQMIQQREGCTEIYCYPPNGENRWYRLVTKLILDRKGNSIYMIGRIKDIQKEKELHDGLCRQALNDGLTDIYNISAAKERIIALLKMQKESIRGVLLIIDIDYFKRINDTFGHYAGDRVLKSVADILKQNVENGDIIGRLGGDEFLVFFKDIREKGEAVLKCQMMLEGIHTIKPEYGFLSISGSIGAAFAAGDTDFPELYKKADKALYEAKDKGRDGYVFFE